LATLPAQLGPVATFAYSPDGKTFLTGLQNGNVVLWQSATGKVIGRVRPHPGRVYKVAFSPDGKTMLSVSQVGSKDPRSPLFTSSVHLWKADTRQPIGELPHAGSINENGVAFSPDSKTILTGSHDGTARFWDTDTAKPLGQPLPLPGRVFAVAFSPDGRMAAIGRWSNMAP
jgi:WD40 repeat protein